jgi:hypothetical protein
MATDKKHIAVYLDPAVEQALIAFCEQKGMVSKKGFMYSAGVNAVLAEFFGLSSAEPGNTPQKLRNIPSELNNTPLLDSNILIADNIPTDTVTQEVTNTRISALEERIEVLQESLQESLKALWEALPGKLESGDSAELPKVDSEVVEQLQNNELGNLKAEPEDIEFLKRLLAKKDPLISSDLWQEIERLKERNRQLRLKIGAERRESIEKISDLEDWNKGLTRRVQEKQARLDELEAQLEQERASREEITNSVPIARGVEFLEPAIILSQLRTKRKKSKADLADIEAILELLEGAR